MDVSRAMIEPLEWTPPAVGAAVEVEQGIRWIRQAVPGALRHINLWLLPGREGCVLVDTGMNLPETLEAWEGLAEREQLSRSLRGIIVTHHHPDHLGMAAHLSRRFGVPARMSAAARTVAADLLAGVAARPPDVLEAYREEWGFDFRDLIDTGRDGSGSFVRLITGLPEPAPPLVAEERPAELRDPWRTSLHFGHAEGHACLHWDEGGMFVSGDQLLPTISSNISLYPGIVSADPLEDFFDSLERLDRLPPDTIVLPAHGLPFRGVQARVAALRAEHEGRLVEIERFCARPRAIAEIVTLLFGSRRLEGTNKMLAYGEALAHVRYLCLRSRIVRLVEGGTVTWARPASRHDWL